MNQKKTAMTPARLAFYSTLLFQAILIATIIILRDLSKDVALASSVLLAVVISCFAIPWFLRKNVTRYQVQIITQQDELKRLSGSAFLGFMLGFLWRCIVVGIVTGAIAALLKRAYGSDINSALLLEIDFLNSFLCSFVAFWWVYAAPMGKNRIVFGPSNSKISLVIDSPTTTKKHEFRNLKDSAESLKETISGFLGVVAAISYFGIGMVQMAAVITFFCDYWGWWFIPSIFVASLIVYIPIIGAVAGIVAAMKVWGWSLFPSVALFCFPLVIMVLIVMVAGVSVATSALFGRWLRKH